MPEQIRQVTPPRGWARLAFRLPIWFYRLGLGGLLGKRFLLLTHTGRKSGQPRQTVLEVVRYDPDSTTFIVASGFGEKSDWVRNLRQNPDVTVQCWRQQWDMVARFLTPQEAGSELLDYSRRHPLAMQELARFMGYRLDGTREDIESLGRILPMVALHG